LTPVVVDTLIMNGLRLTTENDRDCGARKSSSYPILEWHLMHQVIMKSSPICSFKTRAYDNKVNAHHDDICKQHTFINVPQGHARVLGAKLHHAELLAERVFVFHFGT
jgi:hypothetical protein